MRNRNGIFAEQYATNQQMIGTDYSHVFALCNHEFVGQVVSVPGGTTDEETGSEPFGGIFGIINASKAL